MASCRKQSGERSQMKWTKKDDAFSFKCLTYDNISWMQNLFPRVQNLLKFWEARHLLNLSFYILCMFIFLSFSPFFVVDWLPSYVKFSIRASSFLKFIPSVNYFPKSCHIYIQRLNLSSDLPCPKVLFGHLLNLVSSFKNVMGLILFSTLLPEIHIMNLIGSTSPIFLFTFSPFLLIEVQISLHVNWTCLCVVST